MASPNSHKLILLVALTFAGCEPTPVPPAPKGGTAYTKPTPTADGRVPVNLTERGAELERRIDLMEAEMRRIEMGLDESQRGRRARK